jgi:hypothetical protein
MGYILTRIMERVYNLTRTNSKITTEVLTDSAGAIITDNTTSALYVFEII